MSKGTNAWNKVVSAALKLPGVTVDRQKFLEAELGKYLSEPHLQAAIERGTIDLVPEKILDRIAADCIKSHTKKVSLFPGDGLRWVPFPPTLPNSIFTC